MPHATSILRLVCMTSFRVFINMIYHVDWLRPLLKRAAMVQDESLVVSLIQRHLKYTKSAVARAILNDWQNAKQHFVKVFPHEYARALREQTDTKVRS